MDQLDRRMLAGLVVGIAVGFAVWQLLQSIADAVAGILVDWWEGEDNFGTFDAAFSLGSVEIEYGQVLGALLGFLLVVAVALVVLRRIERRPRASS
jgi:large-conductance mechanosensitive channel